MPNTFNPTKNVWQQLANEQAFKMMESGNLNSKTPITEYDPIYNQLVAQIGVTMYRKLQYLQQWRNIGRTAPANAYPEILREIIMRDRKGENYPYDNGTKPSQLNCYDIVDDELAVRYHFAQFRWMYKFTIYDEILRAYSGGTGNTIANISEMKMMNGINARNRFCDALRKQTLNKLMGNAATRLTVPGDLSSNALTRDEAIEWLAFIDNVLFELSVGTSLYNGEGINMQVPRADMQLIMPRQYYNRLMRTAFPDTFSETRFTDYLIPENLILIDTFATETLTDSGGNPLTPTFSENGLNQLTWTDASTWSDNNPDIMAVIMHRDCIGIEDNLDQVLMAEKDIEKLATAGRMHFWTKAYYTDLLPSVVIEKESA